jgi:hypothetical protein
MGLQIQFIDKTGAKPIECTRFELKETVDRNKIRSWAIPELVISPANNNLPLVRSIVSQVSGVPSVIASRIQSAYPTKDYPKLVLLTADRSLVGILIPDAGVLPDGIDCTLTVSITYQDSDAGKPVPGTERTVTHSCKLFKGQVSTSMSVPISTGENTQLYARPATALAQLGGRVQLTLDMVHGPTGAVPQVQLGYPETLLAPSDPLVTSLASVLPQLTDLLKSAVSTAPQNVSVDGNIQSFLFQFALRIPDSVRNTLSKLKEPLLVKLISTVPNTKGRVEHYLKLESENEPFPGWLVIDFGTTNSTVTVHAPYQDEAAVGLPDEQRDALSSKLADWLGKTAADALQPNGQRFESDWQKLLREVATSVVGSGSVKALTDAVADTKKSKVYQVITQLQITLRPKPMEFRRIVQIHLHKFCHHSLRVPSLKRRHLYPVTLDSTRKLQTLESEMEIVGMKVVDSQTRPIVRMGKEVRDKRLGEIASEGADLNSIRSRFHPSPKRYFGTEKESIPVEFDGQPYSVTVDQLMQAGWGYLFELTDKARTKLEEFRGNGPFRNVVITYPTVAPPSIRQKIQDLVRGLGANDVRTEYDEAVAAAIFYLMREYGGAADIGLESFKARCRPTKNGQWRQNVMVFDIGGGTTDVALLEISLVEQSVFTPMEDRGAGGRFYSIKPKLLSSTGHMQLGGELMTLRIFHYLKATIADKLLLLVQDGRIKSDAMKTILTQNMPEAFLDAKSKYKSGEMRRPFDQLGWEPGDKPTKEARDLAELVLPTRWETDRKEERARRLQAFYTLWDLAEEVKKAIGGRSEQSNMLQLTSTTPPYKFKSELLKQLIDACRPELAATFSKEQIEKELPVSMSVEQLEGVIGKVIDDAVAIASGVLEHLPEGDFVDWLILSGQSCNLALVDDRIRTAFEKSKRFIWNPERVTFDKKYAKQATSIGACFAEGYRRRNFAAANYKPELLRGVNVLEYDINNLFRTLPCNINLLLQDTSRELFKAGRELSELDPVPQELDRRAKARSGWGDTNITMTLMRQDYNGGRSDIWGNYDAATRMDRIKIDNIEEWKNNIKVEFEVDHRMDVEMLFCRLDKNQTEPLLLLSGREPQANLLEGLSRLAPNPAAAQATVPSPGAPVPAPPRMPNLFDNEGKLAWDLEVRVTNVTSGTVIFKRGQKFTTQFGQTPKTPAVKVMRSEDTFEQFPKDGPDSEPLEVWGKPSEGVAPIRLGHIRRPDFLPMFRRLCRFTLDESGILRMHPGEPHYLESNDETVLKSRPGVVFREKIKPLRREIDESRNPFSGEH